MGTTRAAATAGTSERAAQRATSSQLTLPVVGAVPISGDQLAYFGGLGALAVLGILDWPVAVALGVGHALVRRKSSGALREFGAALDEA